MPALVIRDRNYQLDIVHQRSSTYIKMQMKSPLLTTSKLPHTHAVLSLQLPNIHSSRCFNIAHLPFSEEVRNTEIGHLFEHILLEYIHQLKVLSQQKSTLISGETSWNWHKDPPGVFHITLSVGAAETNLFLTALTKSRKLLNQIIN